MPKSALMPSVGRPGWFPRWRREVPSPHSFRLEVWFGAGRWTGRCRSRRRPSRPGCQRVAVRIRRRDGGTDVLARCRVLGDAARGRGSLGEDRRGVGGGGGGVVAVGGVGGAHGVDGGDAVVAGGGGVEPHVGVGGVGAPGVGDEVGPATAVGGDLNLVAGDGGAAGAGRGGPGEVDLGRPVGGRGQPGGRAGRGRWRRRRRKVARDKRDAYGGSVSQ